MALPGSGAISLNDVATEFGGTIPHSLSEYYGADTGVPSSGTISLSDFYGTSAGTPTPTINIYMVGGGGSGGYFSGSTIGQACGGGGGGRYIANTNYSINTNQYDPVVGAGGTLGVTGSAGVSTAGAGGNSQLKQSSTVLIDADGGPQGFAYSTSSSTGYGMNGGGGYGATSVANQGSTSATWSPYQSGAGADGSTIYASGGGGAGSGGNGSNGSTPSSAVGGDGGIGTSMPTSSTTTRTVGAGGGGGAASAGSATPGAGGRGNSSYGTGANSPNFGGSNANPGQDGYGEGGGGGTSSRFAADGGDGLIVITHTLLYTGQYRDLNISPTPSSVFTDNNLRWYIITQTSTMSA